MAGFEQLLQQQLQHFQDQCQEHMNIRLAHIKATIANNQISSRNRRSHALAIPGDGHALALAICEYEILPGYALNFHPEAPLGTVPADWNRNIHSYTIRDVLRLVVFYNDDFGIYLDDSLAVKRDKVRAWLCDQE
ncbi:hypothetical protein BGY98DRAFT_942701 [Russula aff. rugulosa BPL654]|nr:hypothetical protein BGY98DRAFT_942701 [Russula aff. rugulosa BPL654]